MTVESFGSEEYQNKPFYQVWIDALTKPTVENYQQIVNDPNASLGTALLWLAGVGFINSLIASVFQNIFGADILRDYLGTEFAPRVTFLGILGGAFASIFIFPIISLIMTGLVHLVASALGGTGSFEKLFYGFATYVVPFSLINAVVGGIPWVNCLAIPLLVYAAVLNVLANQAVHEYETWKAIVSSIGVPLIIFIFLFACLLILIVLGLASFVPILEDISNQLGMMIIAW